MQMQILNLFWKKKWPSCLRVKQASLCIPAIPVLCDMPQRNTACSIMALILQCIIKMDDDS